MAARQHEALHPSMRARSTRSRRRRCILATDRCTSSAGSWTSGSTRLSARKSAFMAITESGFRSSWATIASTALRRTISSSATDSASAVLRREVTALSTRRRSASSFSSVATRRACSAGSTIGWSRCVRTAWSERARSCWRTASLISRSSVLATSDDARSRVTESRDAAEASRSRARTTSASSRNLRSCSSTMIRSRSMRSSAWCRARATASFATASALARSTPRLASVSSRLSAMLLRAVSIVAGISSAPRRRQKRQSRQIWSA